MNPTRSFLASLVETDGYIENVVMNLELASDEREASTVFGFIGYWMVEDEKEASH